MPGEAANISPSASSSHISENLIAALKDATLAGLVAGFLAIPLLGFDLVDNLRGPILETRFWWVPLAAAIVFAGRLALRLGGIALAPRFAAWKAKAPAHSKVMRWRSWTGWAMAGFAIVLPLLPFANRDVLDLATLVLIYVMLGWGLNIVVGLAGLLDLGYVAFYAVGAYTYGILARDFGMSFWECLPLAGAAAAFVGILLGFPVLRLRGDYLAIVTLGFGEIVRVILLNWGDMTGGPNGIDSIPRPTFFGLPFLAEAPEEGGTTFAEFFHLDFAQIHRIIFLYYIVVILALATNLFTLRLRKLPIGRAWEALREDETACRSLGINPTTIKLSAFAIGAMFAGLAGPLFAARQAFISPESYSFIESAIILAIVVLGGMGSQVGIVLAALLLVGLPEWFREFQSFRMVAFGATMVLIMVWRPRGLLSSRDPTIRLSPP